jgi:hypothetical protein
LIKNDVQEFHLWISLCVLFLSGFNSSGENRSGEVNWRAGGKKYSENRRKTFHESLTRAKQVKPSQAKPIGQGKEVKEPRKVRSKLYMPTQGKQGRLGKKTMLKRAFL